MSLKAFQLKKKKKETTNKRKNQPVYNSIWSLFNRSVH